MNDITLPLKSSKRFQAWVTDSPLLIEQAQRLRYRVFVQEMGARIKSAAEQRDYDEIDAYCDHLIVYDTRAEKIVGYTRLLAQTQAQRLGYFYSQHEFDLASVLALPGNFLEIGRTCIDPDYRGSAVLTTLWSALAQYALAGQFTYLIGCASVPPGPNGFAVDAVLRGIKQENRAPAALQVTPTRTIPPHLRCERDESGIPPLLKAYLRLGALICGEPFWDEDFQVMDLFVLLPLEYLQARYSRHYLQQNTVDYVREPAVFL
jgi:putative hemolysin